MAAATKIQIEVEMPRIVDAVIQQLAKDGTLVEVVRCGKCWKRNKGDYCPLVTDDCYPPDLPDDWYCADGERRADE